MLAVFFALRCRSRVEQPIHRRSVLIEIGFVHAIAISMLAWSFRVSAGSNALEFNSKFMWESRSYEQKNIAEFDLNVPVALWQ